MDYLSLGLVAAVCLLFVVSLCLGWMLCQRSGPLLAVVRPPSPVTGETASLPTPVGEVPPAPTHAKCNVRHYIFKRVDPDTGETVQADVWRHPICENLSFDVLADAVQAASFLGGHPDMGWQHTETRGEVHLVELA